MKLKVLPKKLVSEGLAKIRDNSRDKSLEEAQEAAKAAEKGIWATDASEHVRQITWDTSMEQGSHRQLVDRMQGKPVSAIIENGRDGRPANDSTAEPYGLEAHYFTEARLLQREVQIILESVNNNNFIGSVIHPNGNIAEALLREGLAKCVEWSLGCVTGGGEKYRQAQAAAKEKKLKVWKDFVSSGPVIPAKDKEFTGKVIEIVNGDAIMVKKSKTETKKIHLASIRPPRLSDNEERPTKASGSQFRPLYDIPFMFEAREFLRKKLIGQNVHITVDYIQPANTNVGGQEFPEKTCSTVTIGGVNVAEALVSKGLATVVRYAADNDQRSSKYDDLLAAEDKAMKSKKGMHQGKNQKDQTTRRIADVSGDVAKSKQFLPFLQRAGRMQAVVEFIASASRYRLYIPRETCVITFLLSGISCPRGDRTMPGGVFTEGEPFGNEATAFIKEQIMQKEVEIEVETMDKGGNFIGWCFDGINNMSVQLVEEGFASAFMADRSNYGSQVQSAEDSAKRRRIRRWANYSEEEANKDTTKVEEESEKKDSEEERKVNYTKVVATEVTDDAKVYAQHIDEGPKLEGLMKQIREEFSTNPPLAGAYQPKKGDLCAAKFVDGQWYRAKVEKTSPSGDVSVLYIDYGNRANIPKAKCGTLPGAFVSLPAFAHEYSLALCNLCSDEDYAGQGIKAMREDLLNRELKLNV